MNMSVFKNIAAIEHRKVRAVFIGTTIPTMPKVTPKINEYSIRIPLSFPHNHTNMENKIITPPKDHTYILFQA